jgi:hypothetical protein
MNGALLGQLARRKDQVVETPQKENEWTRCRAGLTVLALSGTRTSSQRTARNQTRQVERSLRRSV